MKNIMECLHSFFNPHKTKTVLVIDDSDVDRTFAARILARRYHVLEARGAKEGLQAALRQKPDLIVLDFMMPEMNGPEVCRILKHDHGMEHVPVIFLTSMDTPQTVVESLEEGAEAYLTKPVKAYDLLEQVALRIEPAGCSGKDA